MAEKRDPTIGVWSAPDAIMMIGNVLRCLSSESKVDTSYGSCILLFHEEVEQT